MTDAVSRGRQRPNYYLLRPHSASRRLLASRVLAGAPARRTRDARRRVLADLARKSRQLRRAGHIEAGWILPLLGVIVARVGRGEISLENSAQCAVLRLPELCNASVTKSYVASPVHMWPSSPSSPDVRVAVLDSGVDYTHVAFGGDGTSDSFRRAYGLSHDEADGLRRRALAGEPPFSRDPPRAAELTSDCYGDYFPCGRIVDGWDFVGELWTGDGLHHERPDPNPIDVHGHGTAMAGLIAAIAPSATIMAYKVAASFAGAVSPAAVVAALERALDPAGDGSLEGKADIVNASFGFSSGDPDDALAEIFDQVSAYDVTVLAAAGDDGIDSPIASPACARSVLSVGEVLPPDWTTIAVPIEGTNDCVIGLHQVWSANVAAVDGRQTHAALAEPRVNETIAACALRLANTERLDLTVVNVDQIRQYDNEERLDLPVPVAVAALPTHLTPDSGRHFTVSSHTTISVAGRHQVSTLTSTRMLGRCETAPDVFALGGLDAPAAATGRGYERHFGTSSAAAVASGVAAAAAGRNNDALAAAQLLRQHTNRPGETMSELERLLPGISAVLPGPGPL